MCNKKGGSCKHRFKTPNIRLRFCTDDEDCGCEHMYLVGNDEIRRNANIEKLGKAISEEAAARHRPYG